MALVKLCTYFATGGAGLRITAHPLTLYLSSELIKYQTLMSWTLIIPSQIDVFLSFLNHIIFALRKTVNRIILGIKLGRSVILKYKCIQ